jgi:hypothetical protein
LRKLHYPNPNDLWSKEEMAEINWDESVELDKLAELSIKTGVALQP